MNDQEYERFKDVVLDYAATMPMKKCPRCNGSGKRQSNTPGFQTTCMFCDGKRRVTEEEHEKYMIQAIFP